MGLKESCLSWMAGSAYSLRGLWQIQEWLWTTRQARNWSSINHGQSNVEWARATTLSRRLAHWSQQTNRAGKKRFFVMLSCATSAMIQIVNTPTIACKNHDCADPAHQ